MKLRHHVNNTRNLFDATNMQTRAISSLNQKGMWGGYSTLQTSNA